MDDAKKGLVALGGCVVSENDSERVCRECRRYFRGDGEPYSGDADLPDFGIGGHR